MNTIQNELYHYGVPKMKWGVRHGPPYPLARGGKKLTSLLVKSRDPEKMAAKAKAKQERKEARAERRTQRALQRTENKERKRVERAENEERRKASQEAERLEKRKHDIRTGKINIKDLNDEELKYAKDRLTMEDDVLTRLGKETPAQALRDKKAKELDLVNTVLKDVGKNAIAPLATGLVTDFVYRKLTKQKGGKTTANPNRTMDRLAEEFFKPDNSDEKNQVYTDILNVLSKTDAFGKGMQTSAKQYSARRELRSLIKDDKLFDTIDTMLFANYDLERWADDSASDFDRILERGKRITRTMNQTKK